LYFCAILSRVSPGSIIIIDHPDGNEHEGVGEGINGVAVRSCVGVGVLVGVFGDSDRISTLPVVDV
jgi:hypothetical protein